MVRLRLQLPESAPPRVEVTGAQLHYLKSVLRLTEGDALEVFDGRGFSYDARVAALEAHAAVLELSGRREQRRQRPIAIVQGLPKADKLELVLQKGTELGATAFAPAFTERSVVKLDEKRGKERTQRWQSIAEQAARQCGRADVPTVHEPRALLDAVRAALPNASLVAVLDEEERQVRLEDAHRLSAGAPLVLVVGPEGGLSRDEVAALKAAGAVPVTLGTLVLRTETAALAALAVLRHLDGELG
jgi:16S rRNA (uracil1498-N3)-methyltransferase